MIGWSKTADKRNVVLCWVKLDSEGNLSCRCTSHLNHWERSSNRAVHCAAIACRRGHLVGAQVKKTEGSDEKYYPSRLAPQPNGRVRKIAGVSHNRAATGF
jgi:hypothetical protein